jgi:hypothetical protein
LQRYLFGKDCGYFTLMGPFGVQKQLIDPAPFRYEPRPVWSFIDRKIRDAGPVARDLVSVITSEALSGNFFCGGYNAAANAVRLRETFPEARILIIVREQRSMTRSLYNTWVHWGMPHSVDRMLNPIRLNMVPQFTAEYLCFDALVGHYQHAFGRANVLVLPFEQFHNDPRKFVEQIYCFSGIDASPHLHRLPFKQYRNKSFSPLNQVVQQLINAWLVRTPFNYRGWIPDTPERTMARLGASLRRNSRLPRIFDDHLDRRTRQLIERATEGAFRDSNRKLERLTDLELGRLGYEI